MSCRGVVASGAGLYDEVDVFWQQVIGAGQLDREIAHLLQVVVFGDVALLQG